jgi:hypothetical protein
VEQEPTTPRERASKFIKDLVPDGRPSREQVLWAIRIAIVLVALLAIFVLIANLSSVSVLPLVQLLVTASIPIVIAVAGSRYTQQQAQDAALQAFLDHMSELQANKEQPLHSAQPFDSVSTVARARTLTVLPRLDGSRKWSVLQYLYESKLIKNETLVFFLEGADLSGAYLRGADLSEANLTGANLSGADLKGAYLRGVILSETNLSQANLSEAWLTDPRDGSGVSADLSGANLKETNLKGAYLSGANLKYAKGWTEEQFSAATPFYGATMPNGQKYEDWIKERERRKEAGEEA